MEQFNDAEPSVKERINYFFCLAYPPLWLLKKELGEKFLNIGSAASALQLFEELEMWEECIECYRAMNKEKKATIFSSFH